MLIQSSSLTTILPGSGYVAASPQEQMTTATDELTAKTVALSLAVTGASTQPKMSDFRERLTHPSPYPNAEQTKDWIADWIADPRPCYRAVTAVVQDVLLLDLVSLCVEYAQGTENENVLCPRKWEEMGCRDISIAPSLPLSFEGVWNSVCPGYNGEKVHEICYLQFRPKEVNGKTLTPNVMDELARNVPAHLNRAQIDFAPAAKEKIGNKGLKESAWELVPSKVIEASREKSDKIQETLIPAGWERPHALSLIVANLARYILSGIQRVRMYGDEPATEVRCVEQVRGRRVAVGFMRPAEGSAPVRLRVSRYGCDNSSLAVVGLQQLF